MNNISSTSSSSGKDKGKTPAGSNVNHASGRKEKGKEKISADTILYAAPKPEDRSKYVHLQKPHPDGANRPLQNLWVLKTYYESIEEGEEDSNLVGYNKVNLNDRIIVSDSQTTGSSRAAASSSSGVDSKNIMLLSDVLSMFYGPEMKVFQELFKEVSDGFLNFEYIYSMLKDVQADASFNQDHSNSDPVISQILAACAQFIEPAQVWLDGKQTTGEFEKSISPLTPEKQEKLKKALPNCIQFFKNAIQWVPEKRSRGLTMNMGNQHPLVQQEEENQKRKKREQETAERMEKLREMRRGNENLQPQHEAAVSSIEAHKKSTRERTADQAASEVGQLVSVMNIILDFIKKGSLTTFQALAADRRFAILVNQYRKYSGQKISKTINSLQDLRNISITQDLTPYKLIVSAQFYEGLHDAEHAEFDRLMNDRLLCRDWTVFDASNLVLSQNQQFIAPKWCEKLILGEIQRNIVFPKGERLIDIKLGNMERRVSLTIPARIKKVSLGNILGTVRFEANSQCEEFIANCVFPGVSLTIPANAKKVTLGIFMGTITFEANSQCEELITRPILQTGSVTIPARVKKVILGKVEGSVTFEANSQCQEFIVDRISETAVLNCPNSIRAEMKCKTLINNYPQ